MKLTVELDADSAAPGEAISGRVRVEDGGSARQLLVELVYREMVSDYTGATVRVSVPPLHEGDLETGSAFAFSLQVPPDALPNQSSPHGFVTWTVTARCDRFGADVRDAAAVEVTAA